MIPGWDVGVMQMSLGEKGQLVLAPEYGYGAAGSPPDIPPNAELVFDVHLLAINERREGLGPLRGRRLGPPGGSVGASEWLREASVGPLCGRPRGCWTAAARRGEAEMAVAARRALRCARAGLCARVKLLYVK